ncbi:UNVERIFIED_CONTAM: hypothetical protein Sangu_2161500 [Sesamum angustifolium]|uniref:Uncharacterized protein n=1 Tax=Sesamum angustifolium TaxID=2727405 RepID=A0AAW2LFS7_9LAMI
MHLWPSMRLRDSFKNNYLKKLEWNLHRMNIEKQQQQQRDQSSDNQQKLLENDQTDSKNSGCGGFGVICREVFMVLSCCYCCFCCGVSLYVWVSGRIDITEELVELLAVLVLMHLVLRISLNVVLVSPITECYSVFADVTLVIKHQVINFKDCS